MRRWIWPLLLAPSACAQSGDTPEREPQAEATAEATAELASRDRAAPDPATSAVPIAATAPIWPAPVSAARDGDHVYSKVRHLWIRPQPGGQAWIGYLSLGDAVRVRAGDAAAAKVMGASGKCDAWYAVEPVGFVCTGEDATLDANDPVVVTLRERAAKRDSPWPYQYGESLGARLRPAPPSLALDMPPGGIALQTNVVRGSTLAYTRTFSHEGAPQLLTWDGAMVAKTEVTPYPESRFKGVVLGVEGQLPIAFFRGDDGKRYDERGAVAGAAWPRLSWVELSGAEIDVEGARYYQTKDGAYCAAADVAVARQREQPPAPVALQEGHKRWLDVSILGGTMVAYEDRKPVYATMISPGRGGMPVPKIPTLDTASTPAGTYALLGKFLTATMQSGSIATLIHAEVQYTMNFSGPYALHGAYWHDRFGEKKSGGCVNLSPIDSQRIFEWSEPRLPHGWHGMRTITRNNDFGPPSMVDLHR